MVRNRFMYVFCIMNLEPGIPMLENPTENSNRMLEIIVRNLFRQMKHWRYDFSSLPRDGLVGYDPGIPREEADEVYGILDRVFKEVFPAQAGLSRPEAAEYVEELIAKVREEVLHEGPGLPGARQHLIMFMERLLAAFQKRLASPLDCIEA